MKHRLVIEADGGQHAEADDYDRTRTKALEAAGYHVIRFWNHEIMTMTDAVLDAIIFELIDAGVSGGDDHG